MRRDTRLIPFFIYRTPNNPGKASFKGACLLTEPGTDTRRGGQVSSQLPRGTFLGCFTRSDRTLCLDSTLSALFSAAQVMFLKTRIPAEAVDVADFVP